MKNILNAPFVEEMKKTCANMYRLGWDERNGGNISYLLKKEEVWHGCWQLLLQGFRSGRVNMYGVRSCRPTCCIFMCARQRSLSAQGM